VTSFEFTAQPVTAVHFGTIGYQPADLPRLIGGWRDLTRASDENLTTALNLLPPVPGQPAGPPAAMLQCCYAGPDGDAAADALRPFRALAPVTADTVRVMAYAEVLESCPALPPGARMEVRNAFLQDLDDQTIAAIAELREDGVMIGLRSLGGAAARVAPDATAYAHRDAEALVFAGVMLPPGAPPKLAGSALAQWPAVADRGSGAYVNFLGTATGADIARAYPVPTYQRLAAIKRRYDPRNVFGRNHNIRPAHA
jgi:hypothetical protein